MPRIAINEKKIDTGEKPYDRKTRNLENIINEDNEVFISYDGIEHVFDNTIYNKLCDIDKTACYSELIRDPRLIAVHKNNLSLLKSLNHKILKIARTLADMQGSEHIAHEHLIEALSYRAMDRILRHLTEAIAI